MKKYINNCFINTKVKELALQLSERTYMDNHEPVIKENYSDITAEEIADMYKERWEIESFYRWIKQNLNVPVLFGTTQNDVFSQLFAALITYVLLKIFIY